MATKGEVREKVDVTQWMRKYGSWGTLALAAQLHGKAEMPR